MPEQISRQSSFASQPRDRLQSLDLLRGIAIISVILFHFFGDFEGWESLSGDGLVKNLSEQNFSFYLFYPLSYGDVGVSLFFIISGFCIHYKYVKQLKQSGKYAFDAKEFLSKRLLRIYPPYFVALIGFTILHLLLTRSNYFWGWNNLITHLFLIHNFWKDTFYTINVSFWSIAIEMQFYLLYPLFLVGCSRIGTAKTTFLLVFLSLLIIPVRLLEVSFDTADFTYSFYSSTLFLWSSWALGALIAEKYVLQERLMKLKSLRFALILFLSLYVLTDFVKPLSFASFWIGSFAAFFLVAILVQREAESKMSPERANDDKPSQESLCVRFLKFTGVISYSLYLLHQPIMGYLHHVVIRLGLPVAPGIRWVLLPLYLVIIYIISWLFFKVIEEKSHKVARKMSIKALITKFG